MKDFLEFTKDLEAEDIAIAFNYITNQIMGKDNRNITLSAFDFGKKSQENIKKGQKQFDLLLCELFN